MQAAAALGLCGAHAAVAPARGRGGPHREPHAVQHCAAAVLEPRRDAVGDRHGRHAAAGRAARLAVSAAGAACGRGQRAGAHGSILRASTRKRALARDEEAAGEEAVAVRARPRLWAVPV